MRRGNKRLDQTVYGAGQAILSFTVCLFLSVCPCLSRSIGLLLSAAKIDEENKP